MPRTPRVPLTAWKELTPQLRAKIIGVYPTGASMPDRVEAVNRAQGGYTKY